MKVFTALIPLISLASAQVNWDDWHPAGEGEVRGPCPGLNSLANHGFLPRDGKNITLDKLVKATQAINMTTEVAASLFAGALKTSSDPASGSFSLSDLGKHNIIEHDGSLSRADVGTPGAGDQEFNPTVFDEFKSYFNGSTQISLPLAAAGRWGRIQSARASNPNFVYGPSQRFSSYAETAVYFELFQDPKTNTVPLEYLEIMFSEERLPAKEGWRPVNSINGLGTAAVILQLAMFTDEKAGDLVLPHYSEHLRSAPRMQTTLLV